ncbi:1-deoxy-D-xylulose-5-phosphate synthase N-terminal domain-containing protein [Streptomyces sp. NBC_00878]|uniref:1-deoxy-D-xylulose-5-phosphate synthase N-terminal domain-containing protein n=1 Tax=Streptomyces sp. NBC_00878 TaxID=2975854 RepID=UPI00224EAF76|nr:1-deoxy-D-xylulose-5-phosphate synthase N-terminal domain-containing protein [Streptomyces sp. NBC_00878]MCX4910120.1 hypothetical protein [Streptomyces sp. NBC_00878]
MDQGPTAGQALSAMCAPTAVKALPAERLVELAPEIRENPVAKVCAVGGYRGPSLGVVGLACSKAAKCTIERQMIARRHDAVLALLNTLTSRPPAPVPHLRRLEDSTTRRAS